MLKQVTHIFSHIEIATEIWNTSAAGSGHNEHSVYVVKKKRISTFNNIYIKSLYFFNQNPVK